MLTPRTGLPYIGNVAANSAAGISLLQTRRASATSDGVFYCPQFMAGRIGTLGWPLSVCGKANLYGLPPISRLASAGGRSSHTENCHV